MAKFPPNKYQEQILDWVLNGSGNAIVNAKAGTGKTSTLEYIAEQYSGKMLFLAFNNHIAAEINNKPELQKFLTPKKDGGLGTLKAMTTNALGNMTLLTDIEKRKLKPTKKTGFLNEKKMFSILREIITDNCAIRGEYITEPMLWNMQKGVKELCDLARQKYVKHTRDAMKRTREEYNLCEFFELDENENPIHYPQLDWDGIAEEAVERSLEIWDEKGEYDFVEQLYIPVVRKLYPPAWVAYFSYFIGIDEAQDYSALQLTFIKKLEYMQPQYGKKFETRYLFVGDVNQAIYSFAGADCHSMENIEKKYNTANFDLNICYRCSKEVIRIAQLDVPDIEAAPNAKDGAVYHIKNEEIADYVKVNDMVIARKNKDLADIFIQIVKKGIPVYIKDKDLVENTIKSIKGLNCKDINRLNEAIIKVQAEFKQAMNNPENATISSAVNNGKMDIYDTVLVLLDYFKEKYPTKTNVEDFMSFVLELLITESSTDAVLVSSIHQVKGLEANTVFIINYNLMPYSFKNQSADEAVQERNLRYIAVTRAKENLYLCEGEEEE